MNDAQLHQHKMSDRIPVILLLASNELRPLTPARMLEPLLSLSSIQETFKSNPPLNPSIGAST